MSEEKLEQPNVKIPEGKKDKKEKKKRKNVIGRWFREMKSELKKVVWPTPKQIMNQTAIVIVIMIVFGIVLWAVDQAGTLIVTTLIRLGNIGGM